MLDSSTQILTSALGIHAVNPELTTPASELPTYLAEELVTDAEMQRRVFHVDLPPLLTVHRCALSGGRRWLQCPVFEHCTTGANGS